MSNYVDDRDECAETENLCGMEAGCLNTVGSYKCICNHDLQEMDPIKGCDQTIMHNGSHSIHKQETAHSPGQKQLWIPKIVISPNTNGSGVDLPLGSNHIGGIIQDQDTEKNNTTSGYLQTTDDAGPMPTVLLACLLAAAVVLLLTLGVCLWKRRYCRRLCYRHKPSSPSAGSLSKCLQQYVSNPNYYSSSPDAMLFKILRDIEIPYERLTFMEEVGEGCFGKVYKGIYNRREGGAIPVAVKVLKEGATTEAQADFEREVEIMSAFDHENILKLLGVVIKDGVMTPWMVFEFMQFGDLADLLRKNSSYTPRSSTENFCRLERVDLGWISTQIANGMVYLSSQHFTHRDLATRNCLVGENLSVKISDFGMSRDIYTCDYYKIGGSRLLPVRWMAPESIMYGKFTLESDVWSYGVVLWEIFTYGKQPYFGNSNEEVVKLILQGLLLTAPDDCPPYICTIMAGCWRTEPRDRLKFNEIFNRLLANCPYRNTQPDTPPDYREELDADNYLLPSHHATHFV